MNKQITVFLKRRWYGASRGDSPLASFRIFSLNTGQRVAHIFELIAQGCHGIGLVVLNVSTSVISGAVETIVVAASTAIVRMIAAIGIIITIVVCIAPKIAITDFALFVQTTFNNTIFICQAQDVCLWSKHSIRINGPDVPPVTSTYTFTIHWNPHR
jgi:hypothetical protein